MDRTKACVCSSIRGALWPAPPFSIRYGKKRLCRKREVCLKRKCMERKWCVYYVEEGPGSRLLCVAQGMEKEIV